MNKGEYFFITDQTVNNQNKTETKTSGEDNSEAILIGLTVAFTIIGLVGAALGTVFYLKRKNKF